MIRILREGFSSETLFFVTAFLLAILFSISIHEFAHAFVANKMGDDTAKRLGRYTVNPIAHLDPFGTLSFVLFGFGWAKPVPINPLKFKEYKKGIFLTSVAGIVANIFVAFFTAGLYVLILKVGATTGSEFLNFVVIFLTYLFKELFILNLGLAVFNLIPIFPLDGFNIIYSLSKRENKFLRFMMKYGAFILLAFFITSFFDIALNYVVNLIGVPMIDFWEFFLVI